MAAADSGRLCCVLLGMRSERQREVGQMTPFDLTLLLLLVRGAERNDRPDTAVLGDFAPPLTGDKCLARSSRRESSLP